jgi:hypothetical protein
MMRTLKWQGEELRIEAMKEYTAWEQWVATKFNDIGKRWPSCDACAMECEGCFWNLVGLEEDAVTFLERVVSFVESAVEELYVHPDWDADEIAEYGEETAYLVNLYFRITQETT